MKHLIDTIADSFPAADCLSYVEKLCQWDRYQASEGIELAAKFVADTLDQFGLAEIRVHRYACPTRWWTFEGPSSWTPRHALLRTEGVDIIRYPADALCLATYSAPARLRAVPLRRYGEGNPRDSVILLDTEDVPAGIDAVAQSGAVGIIANPLGGRLPGARARIELPPDTRMFGFSVTAIEFERFRRAREVDVEVCIDRKATMPIVEARLPGSACLSEIIVQAHLCHPRPGANDNGSGVGAALGVAKVLASRSGSWPRGVRFLFGPEFLGTVAYVHDFLQTGARPRAVAAINIDMAGESPERCGGPLTIELPPDHMPSPLGAIADHVIRQLPDHIRTYSGALTPYFRNSITIPFAGGSDHAIYADRSVAIPAIMIGHWPDKFNHTSFDTPDKIDLQELRRSATLAGTCAWAMATVDSTMHEEISHVIVHQMLRRLLEATAVPQIDYEWMHHLAECGRSQITALENLTGVKSKDARAVIDEQTRSICRLHGLSPIRSSQNPGATVQRSWAGPFNVRGLLHSATKPTGIRLRQRLASDKSTYSAILAVALAIDNRSDRTGIIRRAGYSMMRKIDETLAHDVLDAMLSAGWAAEG